MGAAPAVLVIAATDSSGGAGLTRDVQTLQDFGVAVRCVVTAITAQSDEKVLAVQPLPASLVRAQLAAALQAPGLSAVKIGLLGSAAAVRIVAECLPAREELPIVLDPVLLASSGGALLDEAGRLALRTLLLPRVSLLTPNLPEAATLLGAPIARGPAACRAQLEQLRALGAAAVLLKGGHAHVADADATVTDWLAVDGAEPQPLTVPRVPAQARGTGCSGASAIAAQLACGVTLVQACRRAQNYVAERLQRAADESRT